MQLILTGVERRDRVLRSLAGVCGGKLKTEWDGVSFPIIVGNNKGMDEIQRIRNKEKKPYLYIDHAYFNRNPEMTRYRLCVSNYHCTDWRDSDRTPECKLSEWKQGKNIVVIQPAPKVWEIHPVKAWFEETMDELKKHTKRKIIVKKKGEGALNDVLKNAWAAVCYGSVADVDAVRLGVPVFTHHTSPAYPIGLHDLSQIESPIMPDRSQWLRSLAGCEWGLDEAAKAWERVRPLVCG